jgi:hypothetical protein
VAAAERDPALLLVVLVDERPEMAGDIADRGAGHPVGVAQATQATPGEDLVDARRWPAQERREPVGSIAPGRPSGEDLGLDGR